MKTSQVQTDAGPPTNQALCDRGCDITKAVTLIHNNTSSSSSFTVVQVTARWRAAAFLHWKAMSAIQSVRSSASSPGVSSDLKDHHHN
ncbi:hypothetical protein E2C01_042203 [Portunus trituberculatus]|uniref:Uncharacterized protein n=1 Tax=Portunus trituberculatus TaxID=210409 RepID=A0A5B7FL58_PORTR|nr:hypothetical protein [Portunus trituberculatus]